MLQRFFILLIAFYQCALSPFWGQHCLVLPTCSAYTKEAILRYGVIKGVYLGIKRLLRCHPFHPGGFDPVP
jgi:putative membrane protein insertion efficiency factor